MKLLLFESLRLYTDPNLKQQYIGHIESTPRSKGGSAIVPIECKGSNGKVRKTKYHLTRIMPAMKPNDSDNKMQNMSGRLSKNENNNNICVPERLKTKTQDPGDQFATNI